MGGLERRVEVERGVYFIAGLNYLRVERGFEYDFSPFSECIWGWKEGLEEDGCSRLEALLSASTQFLNRLSFYWCFFL